LENLEHMFNKEIQEKKSIGRGVFNRATRTGRIGKVTMPTDRMSKKERKEYTKSSEVRCFKMTDIYMTWEEFNALPKEKKLQTVAGWLEGNTIGEIAQKLNVSGKKISPYFSALKRTGRINTMDQKSMTKVETPPVSVLNLKLPPFLISLNGEYEGKAVIEKLLKLGQALDEPTRYSVKLEIVEV
jgi:hypothetical protein